MNPASGQGYRRSEPTAPVIVLLAAGESRRYGSPKQLAMIQGEPMVRRVARIALGANVPVMVVIGSRGDQVAAVLEGMPIQIVRCNNWSDGMGSSLAAGARAVQQGFPDTSGLLLCLADQPLIETGMLMQLLQRHRQAPRKILATEHQQALGPPILFPGDCLDELAQWSGQDGARALLQRHWQRVERCLAGVGIDVDTPAARDQINLLLAGHEQPDRD